MLGFIAGDPPCSLEEDRKGEASEPQDQAVPRSQGCPQSCGCCLWRLLPPWEECEEAWGGVRVTGSGETAGEEGPGPAVRGCQDSAPRDGRSPGSLPAGLCPVRPCGDQLPMGRDRTNIVALASGRDSVVCHHWPDRGSGNMWSRGRGRAPVTRQSLDSERRRPFFPQTQAPVPNRQRFWERGRVQGPGASETDTRHPLPGTPTDWAQGTRGTLTSLSRARGTCTSLSRARGTRAALSRAQPVEEGIQQQSPPLPPSDSDHAASSAPPSFFLAFWSGI